MSVRRKCRDLATVAAVAAMTLGVAAVGPLAAPAQAQQATVLHVAITQDTDTMNPFLAEFAVTADIGRLMYEFLTTYDPKTQAPVPGLAKSWETSADKLTWTYTIRDAKWSDGQPITAHDAEFTFNLMMTNKDAASANGNFTANFDTVTAPDDHTLVVKTKKPQATMLALDVPIVPKHIWQNVTNIKDYPNDQGPVVGSGPFILMDYKPKQWVKLKANKDYWRGPAKIDELQFITYTSADAAVQALRKGEVDLISRLNATQFDALKEDPNITVNKAQGRRYNELLINFGVAAKNNEPIGDGNPALKDIKLRQAIAQAIDVDGLLDKVLHGYGQRATGIIPSANPDFHWNPTGDQLRKFNPDAANKALDDAGYPKGGDGIRTDHSGKPLNLRLLERSDRINDTQAGEFVKGWLKAVGIAVDAKSVSGAQMNEATGAGNYDLAFSSYGTNPDPDYALSLHTCAQRPEPNGKGGSTDSFFCDQTYDALYAQQLSEFDRGKRADLVHQMQARFNDQVPSILLWYENSLEAYRKDKFSHFQIQPDPDGVIMQQNGYWGYYSAEPAGSGSGSPAASGDGGDTNKGLIIGIILAIVVVGGGGAFLLTRRRKSGADDRE